MTEIRSEWAEDNPTSTPKLTPFAAPVELQINVPTNVPEFLAKRDLVATTPEGGIATFIEGPTPFLPGLAHSGGGRKFKSFIFLPIEPS